MTEKILGYRLRSGLLLLLVLSLLGWPHPVSFAENLAADGKPIVYFGVIPRYNPMVMYRNYQPLMDYLTEQTDYHFELKLARSYPETVNDLREGKTQLASLGDVTFFEAYSGFGAVPLVRPLNKLGKPTYRSKIVIRSNSPIQSLADLKGKTFAFGSPHSTSGNLIPRLFLFRNGITLFDFADYRNLKSHTAVAKAVLKGKADAGAVKDVVLERYSRYGLRELASSESIPSVPIVAHPSADPRMLQQVRQTLLDIEPSDPEQIRRMQSWDPEFRNGFVAATLEDYRSVFDKMNNFPQKCGGKCH
jgi:phosphonate transport system substrate-binding protein